MSLRTDPIGWLEDLWYRVQPRGDVVGALAQGLAGLPPSARILDFGGGTGRVSEALAAAVPGRFVVADVDTAALTQVPSAFERVVLPSRGPLPFGDEAFDAVFLVDVIHHLPDPPRTLRELRRILKRDGRILLVEYDRSSYAARWLGWFCRVLRGHRLRARAEILGVFRSAGFSVHAERLDGLRTVFRCSGREIARPCPTSAPGAGPRTCAP